MTQPNDPLNIETALAAWTLGRSALDTVPPDLKHKVIQTPQPDLTLLALVGSALKYSPHRWPLPITLEDIPPRPALPLPIVKPVIAERMKSLFLGKGADSVDMGLWLKLLENRGWAFPLYDLALMKKADTLPLIYWPLAQWVRRLEGGDFEFEWAQYLPLNDNDRSTWWDDAIPAERELALLTQAQTAPQHVKPLMFQQFETLARKTKKTLLNRLTIHFTPDDFAPLAQLAHNSTSQADRDDITSVLAYWEHGAGFETARDIFQSGLKIERSMVVNKQIMFTQSDDKTALKTLARAITDLDIALQAQLLGVKIGTYVKMMRQCFEKTSILKTCPALEKAVTSAKDRYDLKLRLQAGPGPDPIPDIIEKLAKAKDDVGLMEALQSQHRRAGTIDKDGLVPSAVRYLEKQFSHKGAKNDEHFVSYYTRDCLHHLIVLLTPAAAQNLIQAFTPYAASVDVQRLLMLADLNAAIPFNPSS